MRGIGHLGDRFYVGPWTLGPLTGLLLCALALAAGILAIAALEGLRTLLGSLSRALLAPAEQAAGPVREMLAESLGDRTLSVAYWLPERRIFVDEAGHAVQLPEPGSGRAWTAVERDGRRVAAIIHDAELDTGPELVNAAAAGAALAIDNERLKADLRARVEELRVSRVRIVEAADHARRRIERDLHDGAQQQLVSLSLDLRLLKAKLNGNEAAAETVDAISEKLSTALAELRELARGIHPVILTERGLVPAVAALAQRAPVPVEADISIHERLTPAIEAAAYFVVAEALTNVAKYAQAENVRVDLRRDEEHVIVLVEDDGVGGADLESGTGLRGLVDRLSALDGTLEVETPEGGGTRLRALIPCTVSDLIVEAMDEHEARTPSGVAAMPRLLLLALLALAVAGCGKVSEVREPDVFAGEGIKPAPLADERAPRGDGDVRIAVVTHATASSTFWSVVRNGVDAAARQMNATVSYKSPDTFSVTRMREFIDEAVDSPARRARGLDPRPRRGSGDPARGARRHPGRVDELRGRPVARVRHPRPRRAARGAGGARGRRAARSGRRTQRDLHQPHAREQVAGDPLRGVRPRDAQARRPVTRVRARRRGPQRGRAEARRGDRAPQGGRGARPRHRRLGGGAGRQEARRPLGAREDRHVRPHARGARGDQGRPDPVRGRPAGLPAGLHADRDAHAGGAATASSRRAATSSPPGRTS